MDHIVWYHLASRFDTASEWRAEKTKSDGEFFPVKLSDKRDASGDGVDGEKVSDRRREFPVEGVGSAKSVPDLAVGADVGVDRAHRDDLGADGRVFGHPNGEVARGTDKFGSVVVEILQLERN